MTADHNADMVDHIAHHPEVRDQALFVGNPDDIVQDRLGPQLPLIRDWTERNFDFTGYVTGFDGTDLAERGKLRAQLGYGDQEQVCIVTVGGSGVGADLLRRVIAAFPAAKDLVPELRMIVVAGPRIDPAALPSHSGLEVVAYVHNLYRHLAACDLAVVQGGLTTAMELTAQRRPFLYFPLRHHFEQNFHVHHRLERYRAGRRMDFDIATPEVIAQAIAEEIGRDVDYLPVEMDGARRPPGGSLSCCRAWPLAVRLHAGGGAISMRCGSLDGSQTGPAGTAGRASVLACSRSAAIAARSSSARVTSDQHQSGHGSTTGRVRSRAGSVSVYRLGDISSGASRRRTRSWKAGPAIPPSSICMRRAPVVSANSVAKSFQACQDVRSASTSTRRLPAGAVSPVRPAGVTATSGSGQSRRRSSRSSRGPAHATAASSPPSRTRAIWMWLGMTHSSTRRSKAVAAGSRSGSRR